jgi:O-antigen ligase
MIRESRLVSPLFLTAVFCSTFEKVHWNVAGTVYLADVTIVAFLAVWAVDRLGRPGHRVPRTAAVLLVFFTAFLLVYLIGFFNLDTAQAADQFGKGIVKWLIHFTFLIVAVAYIAGRSRHYYWRTFWVFIAGMTFNALYGITQLAAAQAGRNLDSFFVKPLTRGASQINIYGAVEGAKVYRPNALTGDPNHLGIMLIVPLLVLVPIYLRLEREHPRRRLLAWLIALLLLVEAATLSRSGVLGLAVGALVLALPYRHYLRSRVLLYPLGGVLAVLVAVFLAERHFFTVVLRSRIDTSSRSESAHFQVYDFIPHVMHVHPFFGLGLNNFSVYYQFVTGKTNWGPHSFYVSLLVETGLVGTALFGLFLYWVFRRLRTARELGRALTAAHHPLAARVRPLAWGYTAALAGTMASNVFYLTMQFYYFYAFLALALAVPLVFATAQSERPKGVGSGSAVRNRGTSRS